MGRILMWLGTFTLAISALCAHAGNCTVLSDFEDSLEGWEIPLWANDKADYVQQGLEVSDEVASRGGKSLLVLADFPGGRWTGAMVEAAGYFDWSGYSRLACDVYIDRGAPRGLKARIMLTVGDGWKWVEMSRFFALVPGEWVTITADLTPGSADWRHVKVDEEFRRDVRKIGIRVESNSRPVYTGPVYIDNVRVIE